MSLSLPPNGLRVFAGSLVCGLLFANAAFSQPKPLASCSLSYSKPKDGFVLRDHPIPLMPKEGTDQLTAESVQIEGADLEVTVSTDAALNGAALILKSSEFQAVIRAGKNSQGRVSLSVGLPSQNLVDLICSRQSP